MGSVGLLPPLVFAIRDRFESCFKSENLRFLNGSSLRVRSPSRYFFPPA